MTNSPSRTIHALACHGAVTMACRGFASLVRCSDRPLRLMVHDDGTLTAEDRARLREAIATIEFVDRDAADDLVGSRLAAHPRCQKFRQQNPLALKLLDIPLMATGGEVACCDTDVLAFAPFSGVFEWPDAETTAVFMRDTQNAYAVRPWHLLVSGVALPMFVNTGLMLFRTAHHDLDFIEWFLERQFAVYRRLPGWIEQTAWAALAFRGCSRLYDAAQVRVVRDERCVDDAGLIIGHFTANVRDLWDRAASRRAPDRGPERVRTVPTTRLSSPQLAAEQVRRLASRTVAWAR